MQFILVIHGLQVGVGVLELPRKLAETAGTDGWISIILGWILTTIASLIIIQVMKKNPHGSILELVTQNFGKLIGKLVTILFALYFAALSVIILIRESLFIQKWLLPQTAFPVLLLLLIIPSYLIVQHNIRVLARYSEFIFYISLWIFIVYLIPTKEAHLLNLLPVLKDGMKPILQAVHSTLLSFIGFEAAFFLYPFLRQKQAAALGIVVANTLSMLLFLIVTIAAFSFFSPDEITQFKEPVINMFKVIEFQFIERLEIIFLTYYIFVISTTALPLLFLTVFCTSKLTGRQDRHSRHLIWFFSALFIYVLMSSPTFQQNSQWQGKIANLSIFVAYLLPLFLWMFLWVKHLFQRRELH
ncbi:spore gernimation protein [Peribacillus loiseleuriae]|uniref:Spore gernimation protein n=2 Tax=Peribacillus loiseleuriae TaxID=1679170 RepID=A0A0K9H056_9BACI|nr:spore gernimation protein [Peribacillus loiseleuriae]